MKLNCIVCEKEYALDPAKIPEQGFKIACTSCGTKYTILLPAGWRNAQSGGGKAPEEVQTTAPPETPPESPTETHQQQPTGIPSDQKYVLLADDTEFFRTMMSDMLVSNGYKVKTAADGQEAMDMFKAAPDAFGLILLDLQMPRLSGFGVLEQLKEIDLTVPPVIVMTGVHDSHEDIQIVRDMGASGFLDKSLDPSVAFERIKMVLDQGK
jgi:CheY-like chemotaxis protein